MLDSSRFMGAFFPISISFLMPAINDLIMTSRSISPASSQGFIQSLPLELIREIFMFSTALKFERLTDDSPIPPRLSTTALALSHVSTHWRSIALSFPELWASIAVCSPTPNIVKLTELYLERAGETSLLDLSLIDVLSKCGPDDTWEADYKIWEACSLRILRLWVPRAHRWVGLNLDLRNLLPVRDLLDIPSQSLKHLETASLDFIHWEYQQVQDMWDKIHTSQNLRELHGGAPLLKHPPLATFHLLTDLFVWTLTLEELATLSSRTRLVKLEAMHVRESPVTGLIELPALETLLTESVRMDSALLLDTISTPSLRHLKLCQTVPLIDASALHRFILRTGCSLLRLHIQILDSSEVDSLRYIQLAAHSFPHLKYFAFRFSGITATTVNEFMPQGKDGTLFLPELEELALLGCRLNDGLVGRMVAARADAGRPLDAFRAWFNDKECDHALDKAILNNLKETGILKQLK
ncbi:hypothetical protein BDN72DRAFT_68149 [Pluteus cervinus]|uniref:Uncharacterized protein n=1 Tax=Pluteus cervinus TaxID=181527 RepID=A0ACD3AQI8_9AGAR|nr:hypothetical protein BDN72DRAFT_68149 [Pluteus cervinus]